MEKDQQLNFNQILIIHQEDHLGELFSLNSLETQKRPVTSLPKRSNLFEKEVKRNSNRVQDDTNLQSETLQLESEDQAKIFPKETSFAPSKKQKTVLLFKKREDGPEQSHSRNKNARASLQKPSLVSKRGGLGNNKQQLKTIRVKMETKKESPYSNFITKRKDQQMQSTDKRKVFKRQLSFNNSNGTFGTKRQLSQKQFLIQENKFPKKFLEDDKKSLLIPKVPTEPNTVPPPDSLQQKGEKHQFSFRKKSPNENSSSNIQDKNDNSENAKEILLPKELENSSLEMSYSQDHNSAPKGLDFMANFTSPTGDLLQTNNKLKQFPST